jgi:hypothetical protein
LGQAPGLPRHCADLLDRKEVMVDMPADVAAVKAYIRAHIGTTA